jgi:hypothetical protein
MWYAVLASGLALSGLIIWALFERYLRRIAELKIAEVEKYRWEAVGIARNNVAIADEMDRERKHSLAELEVLQAIIVELRQRLVDIRDPKAIKEWLDSKLNGEEIL